MSNNQVVITSGKIKGDYCHYSFEERTANGAQVVDVSPEIIIHDDLRLAFRKLVPHLIVICEYKSSSEFIAQAIDDIDSIDESHPLYQILTEFKVSAIKIIGSGDTQGVVITGQKRLINGKLLNLTTPLVKWEDEYEYIQELRANVVDIQSEIILYADGKKAPDNQASLFEDGDEDYDESL